MFPQFRCRWVVRQIMCNTAQCSLSFYYIKHHKRLSNKQPCSSFTSVFSLDLAWKKRNLIPETRVGSNKSQSPLSTQKNNWCLSILFVNTMIYVSKTFICLALSTFAEMLQAFNLHCNHKFICWRCPNMIRWDFILIK